MTTPYRIDVHHHVVPPFWADALPAHGGDPSGWTAPKWSPESDIEMQDKLGIAKAVLSLTAPGIAGWHGQAARDIARQVNEYTADVVQTHAPRFGNFATLPLPDIDGSLQEIAYSLDTLQADGVVLLSSYRGIYLGDPQLEPIWAELDARASVVFIHPTMPAIELLPGIPGPTLDYPFDTTRTALSIVANGITTRYTRCRIILSHAGGFLPYGAYRFAAMVAQLQPQRSLESVVDEMRGFYFDTALSGSPSALPTLMKFARPGHVLFGSDIPYAAFPKVTWFTNNLDNWDGFAPGQLQSINTDAQKLLLRQTT